MISKKIIVLAVATAILLCSSSIALGIVFGSSNLGILGYPKFSPHIYPSKPYSMDQYFVNQYESDVKQYVRVAKDYIEAANNDVKRINENIDEVTTKTNSIIQEYNQFVRGY